MESAEVLASAPPRVCAVSYLNTSPLVWGLEHTDLGRQVRLTYELPSICADRVREGAADIGILPVIEIERQGLHYFPETGIACRGAVRSILLVSRVPLREIRTVAGDAGSRTSVMLTRILLAERYGVEPVIVPMRADLDRMLDEADAALIIGDPAVLLDPVALRSRYEVLDLGEEWFTHTGGQSMIFALWAGPAQFIHAPLGRLFEQSCRYGRERLDEIVAAECPPRGIPLELGHEYLDRYIVSELTPKDHEGLRTYLRLARQFDTLKVSTSVIAV